MCLAILGKLKEKKEEDGFLVGTVDYDGRETKVSLDCVPDIQVGQYTIVHAGFAIAAVNEDEIHQSIETSNRPMAKTA